MSRSEHFRNKTFRNLDISLKIKCPKWAHPKKLFRRPFLPTFSLIYCNVFDISIRWSHDGAGILTGGEDGAVKIWSRSGMLRSTLAQNAAPVYALAWAPDTQSVLFASGNFLTIKSLAPNSKPLQWRAHEALILCVDWSSSNGKIISGIYTIVKTISGIPMANAFFMAAKKSR